MSRETQNNQRVIKTTLVIKRQQFRFDFCNFFASDVCCLQDIGPNSSNKLKLFVYRREISSRLFLQQFKAFFSHNSTPMTRVLFHCFVVISFFSHTEIELHLYM